MACSVTLQGQIVVNPNGCGGGCSSCGSGAGVSMTGKALALKCAQQAFEGVSSTDCPVSISTGGNLGTNFVALPGVSVGEVSLLYVSTQLPVIVRLDATSPVLQGVGGTFPTGFVGGEVLDLVLNGNAVQVTFDAADQTAAQVAARINAGFALSGFAYQAATVADGQLVINGQGSGPAATLAVTASATATALGLAGSAAGTATDLNLQGTNLLQFSTPVTSLQVSGTGLIDVLAAGR